MTSILIIGEIGDGKSSLGNQLLGYDAFKVTDSINSETIFTIGKSNQDNLFVIDTPGLTNLLENKNRMIQLIDYLKQNKKLNAILLVFNFQQVIFSTNYKIIIKILYTIFPYKNIGGHISFIFTNSFTKKGLLSSEQKNSKINKILPEFKKIIEEETGFIFKNAISGFVDCDSEEGIDYNGKLDLERIVKWAASLDNLFDVPDITKNEIQLLKEENKKLKEEIERIKIEMIIKEKKYEKQFDDIKSEISEIKKKLNS